MRRKLLLSLTLVLIISILAGCGMEPKEPNTQNLEQQKTEENQKRLIQNDSMPVLDKSLERSNLTRRLEYMNQSDKISYIYILSEQGQLIEEQQVLGKISSLNSLLTTPSQIIITRGDYGYYQSEQSHVVSSPDFDGSYGENPDGIFWFTPNGEYQEWNGLYYFSSTRQSFTVKPLLTQIQ